MTSVTHWLPTQRNGRATEEALVRRRPRPATVAARPARPAGHRAPRRSTVGFMERRVGVSALLTLGLLVTVGLVAGLLLGSVLLHVLALLGMQPSAPQGSALARTLAGWTL